MIKNRSTGLSDHHVIAISVFALSVLGLVILSSASAIIAHKNFGSNDFYFWRQLGHLSIGLILWIIAYNVPYLVYKKPSPYIYGASILALFLVFIPGIGADYGTSASWIDIPFLPSIQPAEYSKLTMILYLAFLCERKKDQIKDLMNGLMPLVMVVALTVVLLILQPDYGTTLIICFIAFSIIFIAGAERLHLLGGFIMGALMAIIVASNKQYIYNRFTAFLDPFADSLGTGYHIIQSLIAVGSGGFWGKGFGNSRQKFEYIPEAQGDSIFAIASEELGFIRVVPLVLIFLVIAWHGFRIAQKTDDKYGKYLATGITSWLTFQAFINVMVVLAMFPTTGITLPFISYGGSSLIVSFYAVGILMNISKFGGVIVRTNESRSINPEKSFMNKSLYQKHRWR